MEDHSGQYGVGDMAPPADSQAAPEENKERAFPPDDTPPNFTLYVSNLNEKVGETELKRDLELVFAQFGKILRIVAMKSLKRRGQAFIVFESVESAQKALQEMQNFPFYGKPMRIRFSRNKSDAIAKREGSYVPRVKAPKPPKVKAKQGDAASKKRAAAKTKDGKPRVPEIAPPNNILLLTGLPDGVTEMGLAMMFSAYTGFREVKMVPGRPDVAFVEYTSDHLAGEAKRALQGQPISETHALNIAFARK